MSQHTFDPTDWKDFRPHSRRMLDDMLDYLEHIRTRAGWQPIPGQVRGALNEPLPQQPSELADVQAMDPTDVYPCKQQQLRKVIDAFGDMLRRRLQHGPA